MTSGSTSATGGGDRQIYRYVPYPEFHTFLIDQLLAVAGVGLVADTAATALAAIDNVNIMEVAFAVTKFCVNSRIGKTEQVFLVAGKTRAIYSFLVRYIDLGRVVPPQHAETI